LTSCYTTVMSILGTPCYEKVRILSSVELNKMDYKNLIFSYLSIEVEFSFPYNTKYPCIPTRVDDDVDIYPLKGVSVITGAEYLLAKAMNCRMIVKDCVYVPFEFGRTDVSKKKSIKELLECYKTPFRNIVSGLQKMRRGYAKKTFYNLMYKEIGNSIYGQIAMGLSGKNKYDISSKSYKKIQGDFLANPLLASYITGFTRALIGECLHNISILKGDVVSVTTDGFICNIENLEDKILESPKTIKTLLSLYRDLRVILTKESDIELNERLVESREIKSGEVIDIKSSEVIDIDKNIDKNIDLDVDVKPVEIDVGVKPVKSDELNPVKRVEIDPRALELKTMEGEALLSWKTRGQLGVSGSIKAITGYQTKSLSTSVLFDMFKNIIKTEGPKDIQFVMQRLLGALDVYKKDCDVMLVYFDSKYELSYDNKRCIIEADVIKEDKSVFFDSKPWSSINEYGYLRYMRSLNSKPVFNKSYIINSGNAYKEHIETSVRGFIMACVSKNNRYGISNDKFNTYNDIINFIREYEPARSVRVTPSMISNLKNRKTIPRSVPRNEVNEKFIAYVKSSIPSFNDDLFFRELSPKAIKELKDARKKDENLIEDKKIIEDKN